MWSLPLAEARLPFDCLEQQLGEQPSSSTALRVLEVTNFNCVHICVPNTEMHLGSREGPALKTIRSTEEIDTCEIITRQCAKSPEREQGRKSSEEAPGPAGEEGVVQVWAQG